MGRRPQYTRRALSGGVVQLSRLFSGHEGRTLAALEPKEDGMPVAYVQEFDIVDGDTSTTNYDSITEKLGNEPGVQGLIVHTAGFDHDAGVFRILDVWESADALKRFREERLGPVIEELMARNPGATPPQRETSYELHNVIRG
jgi:quinol monooxygenase YgiN